MEAITFATPPQEKVKEVLGQIDNLLKSKQCHCGEQCIQQFHPHDVYRLRQMFLYGKHNSDEIDNHLKRYFHMTVNPRADRGRYILTQHAVCKDAFLTLLGIDEDRFDRCYKEFLEEEVFKELLEKE